MMSAQLGMIPAWQHSASPGVNIKLNDSVQFPEGWTQRTLQPVGMYYTAARIAQPNLGMPIARMLDGHLGFFDSWAFQNRKALVLGGLGLIAAAGFGITALILK